jgi:serine/threonine-protein kinase RsbW
MEILMCGASENSMSVDIVVPNQTRYLRLIGNIAEQIAKQLDASSGDRDTLAYHLDLVLTEATTNAIQYGSPTDAKQSVRVCLSIDDKTLCVRVFDHGQGFDLNAVPTLDLDDLDERGRGIFLIRSLMDSVEYRKTKNGNVLEMRKKFG